MESILLTLLIVCLIIYYTNDKYKKHLSIWSRISDTNMPAACIKFHDSNDVLKVYSRNKGQSMVLKCFNAKHSCESTMFLLTNQDGSPHDLIYGGSMNEEIADMRYIIAKKIAEESDAEFIVLCSDNNIRMMSCSLDEYKTLSYY